MSQVRDSAIKLFGADIHNIHIPIKPTTPFTDLHSLTQIQPLPQPIIIMAGALFALLKWNGLEESTSDEVDVPLNEEVSSEQTDPQDGNDTPRNICKNPALKLVAKVVHRTNENRNAKRNIDQEKVFKKPDKVLQCPRCNSLETKFCYFNNYNVNQPRHFCKNCQRYWTAGGAIRNVPVGAGKRKNKHSALQYCQKPVTPDGASAIQTHSSASGDDMILSSNELSVTSRPIKEREETPLSESLETVLSLNGQRKFDVDFSTIKDDGEDPSSSSMRSNEIEQVGLVQHSNGLIPLHSFHYHPVPAWSYQWNPFWNAKECRSSSTSSRPPYTGSPTMMAVSDFSIPTVILPAAPCSYSGFMSSLAAQKEESSLIGSAFSGISLSSSSVNNTTSSTLGKHSRDGSTLKEAAMKQNLWVPKTVRINGPEEAANSSIWTTLGTKSEHNKIIIKGSVFKSFESKTSADDNRIRRTNPAAFSRSESFQESM